MAKFNWDEGNWPKCAKHGVTQSEVEEATLNARFIVDDPNSHEKRYRTATKLLSGRYVFAVFTVRQHTKETYIRPISARYMHQREVTSYEKDMARTQQ
jgi:uncharacterized protein